MGKTGGRVAHDPNKTPAQSGADTAKTPKPPTAVVATADRGEERGNSRAPRAATSSSRKSVASKVTLLTGNDPTGLESQPTDALPLGAVMRLYRALRGTPYADLLARGVSACMNAPEEMVRFQA